MKRDVEQDQVHERVDVYKYLSSQNSDDPDSKHKLLEKAREEYEQTRKLFKLPTAPYTGYNFT